MQIKIKEITAKPFQSRKTFDDKHIAALAADIKANGLLNPITVRLTRLDGGTHAGYDLIAGECRLRAHQLLGLDNIDATLVEATDQQAAIMAASENIQRQNFTPLEEADAIDKALANSSIEDVAAAFGRPVGYITRRHRLSQLPAKWKKAVESGFAKTWSIAVLMEIARAPEKIQEIFFTHGKNGWLDITVESLRAETFDKDRVLSAAKFETSDCRKCQKSTCAAPELFDDMVTDKKGDQCMDETCWNNKTEEALKSIADKFKSENPKGIIIDHYNAPEGVRKNAINEWECTVAKKPDKNTVPALDLKTGKTVFVKLNKSASEKAAKLDEDGKITMKEKRARLEKRRVIRYIEKIITAIENMAKNRIEVAYANIVPLVTIFGAERLLDNNDGKDPLDCKFDNGHSQPELFICLAPKMIAALRGEAQRNSPEKKRGDIFKEWLEIDTVGLYEESVVEIPEPKAWAAEGKPVKKKKSVRGPTMKEAIETIRRSQN